MTIFSERNKKLCPTKDTKFLIFNLPSKITCPHATEHCKRFCYAVKAETAYPNCLPSRMAKFELSKRDDFVSIMIDEINRHLNRPSYKNAKRVVVRIHESGDFYNVEYMLKWCDIADYFRHDTRLVFMAYTKSVGFYDIIRRGYGKRYTKGLPKNMIIRFSVWDDTPQEQINIASRYNLPIYTAVDKFDKLTPSQNRCRCKDCATCGKCWSNTKKLICEIH